MKAVDELVELAKPKTNKKKENQMKSQRIKTAFTVVITLAVVSAVTTVALIAYNKGVKTGEANQVKLQSTIEQAIKAQVSKQ